MIYHYNIAHTLPVAYCKQVTVRVICVTEPRSDGSSFSPLVGVILVVFVVEVAVISARCFAACLPASGVRWNIQQPLHMNIFLSVVVDCNDHAPVLNVQQ